MIFFSNNWLLYLLPLSVLPAIFHLLSLKKSRRVKFTYVNLVQKVVNQYLPKKKIVELLILVFRCLIIFFMILLFSGPVAYFSPKQRANLNVVILLDNSMSMQQRVGNETKFSMCKKSVIELSKQLMVHNVIPNILIFNEKVIPLREKLSLENILRQIDEIKTTYNSTNLSGALEYVNSMLNSKANLVNKVLIFTDLAEHLIKKEVVVSTLTNATVDIIFCYPKIDVKNLYFESLDTTRKDDFIEIVYKIKATQATENKDIFVKLFMGNSLIDNMYLSDLGRSYTFRRLFDEKFKTDNFGYLFLPSDGLPEDNKFYFSLTTDDHLSGKTLCMINEPPTLRGINSRKFYFEKLKSIGVDVEIKNYYDNLDFSENKLVSYENFIFVGLPELNIISNLRLENKKIVIFPSESSKLDHYDELLDGLEFIRIEKKDTALGVTLGEDVSWNEYFKKFDYDKLVVEKRFVLTVTNKNLWKVLLKFSDGTPALVSNENLYVFCFDPDKSWSNFVLKPIFIGFFDKILRQDKIETEKLKNYYFISEEIPIHEPIEKVKQLSGETFENSIYYDKTYTGIRFYHPGIYEIATSKKNLRIAVNSPIEESNIALADEGKVKKIFTKFVKTNVYFFDISKQKIDKLIQLCIGKELTEPLIWIIVVLFIFETILSRLSKKLV